MGTRTKESIPRCSRQYVTPFSSSRSEEKHFLWRWYCGKKTNRNVVYRGLYSYRQRVRFITLFPNIFFVLFLHKGKVWRVRAAHLHNTARAVSNPSRCFQLSKQRFISLCLLRTHSAAPRESTTFWPLWWRVSLSRVSLSIRVPTTLNHIRFVKFNRILKIIIMIQMYRCITHTKKKLEKYYKIKSKGDQLNVGYDKVNFLLGV